MIDDDLRAWGASARESAPAVSVPQLSARRSWAPAAAAVVVVLFAVSLPFAARVAGRHTAQSPQGQPPRPLRTAVAGVGMRAVTVHGLTVDVPAAWPTGSTRCGAATQDTVILPGPVDACATVNPPKVSYVSFDAAAGLVTGASTAKITLDGHAAVRTTGTVQGQPAEAFEVPSLGASVLLVSSSEATVRRLAATVRIVDADAHGCLSRDPGVLTLPTSRSPTRDGARDQVVPPGADRIVVCAYAGGQVENSAVLTPAQSARLTAAVNSAPTGRSRTPTSDYLPSLCDDPTQNLGYVVHVDYPTGAPVTVVARVALCGDLGASNGARTVQRTDALTQALVDLAGLDGGYPTTVDPAR